MYGWGTVGPMYTCPTGESVFSSSDCPGGGPPSGSALDQMRAEVDALWSYAGAGTMSQAELDWYARNATPNQVGTFTAWLNDNAGKVALGVGGVFALMLLAKAGR